MSDQVTLATRLLDASHRVARRAGPRLQALALLLAGAFLDRFARVRISGARNVPGGAFVVAANHPSMVDAALVAIPLGRRVQFMGKSELFTERWARLLTRLGAFPVRRGTWDEESFGTARAVLARGGVVAIFPEGGISPPEGGLRPAKPGIGHIVQLSGAPVLPVHLGGARALYRPWTNPEVTITVGEPLRFGAPTASPDRDRSTAIASEVLTAVAGLAP